MNIWKYLACSSIPTKDVQKLFKPFIADFIQLLSFPELNAASLLVLSGSHTYQRLLSP